MYEVFRRLSPASLEIGPERVSDWAQGHLLNRSERNSKDVSDFLLALKVYGRPAGAKPSVSGGKHETPCCLDD